MRRRSRPRILTELVGCGISKQEYDILQAEVKKRQTTVAEYLRQVAIRPLMQTAAAAQDSPGKDRPNEED